MLQERMRTRKWDKSSSDAHFPAETHSSYASLRAGVPREKAAEVVLWRMGLVLAGALGIALLANAVLAVLHIG